MPATQACAQNQTRDPSVIYGKDKFESISYIIKEEKFHNDIKFKSKSSRNKRRKR